jgi:hypothetical protein
MYGGATQGEGAVMLENTVKNLKKKKTRKIQNERIPKLFKHTKK